MPLHHRLLFFQYLMPLVYAVLFYFLKVLPNEASLVSTLFFLAGFYLGNILLWADGKFLYPYYNELRTEPKQLITRSVIFLLVYVFLGLFVVTSSGNFIGTGMIFGIGVTLLSELYALRDNPEAFQQKFLFQLKRHLTPLEIRRLVMAFGIVLLVLSIFFFF
jgi:hypothetical protein